ncbi:putative radical SAM protein [Yersinia enterocolitica]|nr:putative radical SAM protein [Yersinia enterocolitica]
MQLQQLVNMFGADLQRRYGEKIHKLTLHGGFSCPNRDGTLGRGGCTFCNVASLADEQMQQQGITQQLAEQAKKANRANATWHTSRPIPVLMQRSMRWR